MNLSVEYLQRTNVIQNLMTFPCSIFLSHKQTGKKVIVCVNKNIETFFIKVWKISQSAHNQALPPFEEFEIKKISELDKEFFNYKILDVKYCSIPSKENSHNHPMSLKLFELYFSDHLSNFKGLLKMKEDWLWYSFLDAHHPEIISLGLTMKRTLRISKNKFIADQKKIVFKNYYKSWKIWLLWKKHMLNFSGLPGEVGFNSYF